jgi:hypothetical protein
MRSVAWPRIGIHLPESLRDSPSDVSIVTITQTRGTSSKCGNGSFVDTMLHLCLA